MTTITIKIPGSVWDDFLDPGATTMEAELELPASTNRSVGKGYQVTYPDVPLDVAAEVADYLRSRGELLLSNSDPEFDGRERGVYRRAIKAADQIDAAIKRS